MSTTKQLIIAITSQWKADGAKAAGADVDKLAASTSKLGFLASGALATAGVAATKFAVDSARSFSGFESGMAEVFSLLPNISNEAMNRMTADVQNFALENGKLTTEVVPALYQALSAGVPQDNVFEFLKTANDAAVGGVTTMETAVDGLTSVVNSYGSDVISVGEASDLMFRAVVDGKTTFEELSSSLYNVIPTAASLGLGFDNVTAALAAMTAAGTPTSVATTQIRQLLVELSKEGTKAAEVFERVAGKSFRQFIDDGGDLNQALALMQAEADQSGVGLNDLFSSVEAGSAALSLSGENAARFTQELENMAEASGFTTDAAETMRDTSAQAFAEMQAAVESLKIAIGEELVPTLTTAAQAATEQIGLMTSTTRFNELREQLRDAGMSWREINQIVGENRAQFDLWRTDADITRDLQLNQQGIEAMEAALTTLPEELARNSSSMEEFAEKARELPQTFHYWELEEIYEQVHRFDTGIKETTASQEKLTFATYNYGEMVAQTVARELAAIDAVEQHHAANIAAETTLEELAQGEREVTTTTQAAVTAGRLAAESFVEQKEKAAEIGEELDALRDHWIDLYNSSSTVVRDLLTAQADLAAAQGEWVETSIDNSGQLSAINAQLASDLTADQKAAYEDILGTVGEGSAEWLAAYSALQGDLTDTQRQELIARQADLSASQGQWATVYTGDVAAAEEAQQQIAEAHAAILASYRAVAFEAVLAQTGVTESTLDLGVQLGILTQQEADMRLEFVTTTAALEDLTSRQEFLTLTTEQQTVAINALAEGQAETADGALYLADQMAGVNETFTTATEKGAFLETVLTDLTENPYELEVEGDSVDEATDKADKLKTAMEDAAGTYSVYFEVDSDPPPDYAGGGSQTPGGNQPPTHLASGGVVTGGIPGLDSVPAMLMPGERVLSVEQNRRFEAMMAGAFSPSGAGVLGGQTVVNEGDEFTFNVQDDSQAHLIAELVRDRRRNRKAFHGVNG